MLAKVGTLGDDLRFAQWCGEQSNLLGCYFVLTINSQQSMIDRAQHPKRL